MRLGFGYPCIKNNYISAIIKLIINHYQIVFLLTTFDYDFPDFITNYLTFLGNPIQLSYTSI